MNQNNITDDSMEVIDNFFILTATNEKLITIRNILKILNEYDIDIDLVAEIKEIILQSEDTENITFEVNKLIFDTAEDILNEYGVKVINSEIKLTMLTNILEIIKELPKFDLLTYDTVMNILTTEEDPVIKMNQLLTFYYRTSEYILYDYVETISDNLFLNLEKELENSKDIEFEIDDEYIEFINYVSKKYQSFLSTNLVKKMVSTGEYVILYDEHTNDVYKYIEEIYKFDIGKSALEIAALLTISKGIENIYYTLDGEIRDDMIELGYDINIINDIVSLTKDILSNEVTYD